MCEITGITKFRQKTGYKVAMKRGDKYYSPSTGIEYKKGKVTIPKKQKNLTVACFVDNILDKTSRCFNKDLVGKTAIFKHKEGVNYLFSYMYFAIKKGYKCVVLKMTLTDKENIKEGRYGDDPVYIGDTIKYFEEI